MKPLRSHLRKNRTQLHGAASRSQAMLEFALALPILLALLFGIIDLAALFQAWLTVENIARQTVRYAVTGQYDPTFCGDGPDAGTDPCAGDGYEAEQDAARLLSIQEYSSRQTVALFLTPGAAQSEIGHLNVIICSSRDIDGDAVPDYTFFEPNSPNYSDCQRGGSTEEDAGGPGDRVIISVDFNHPYITPFFNQVWPMTHLFAHRQGIVEQYRVPRLISLPPLVGLPTLTPSNTPPPTSTGTLTPTGTATNTPLPLYIEIIVPITDGQIITDVEQTRFEAIAWDPTYGTTNGDGIQSIQFWFSGPGIIPGETESVVAYCAFSGNTPCPTMDAKVDHEDLPGGTYTIFAQATASDDGRLSAVVSKTFILQFPPTATPTATYTPTSTPTPSCSNISIYRTYIGGTNTDDFFAILRNDNYGTAYLTRAVFTWNNPNSPPLYWDYFYWDGFGAYYNPSGQYYSGTVTWNYSGGTQPYINGLDDWEAWRADFERVAGHPVAGTFAVTLTLNYPGWGDCVVSTSLIQASPTATLIPPTPTFTPIPPTPTVPIPINCSLISSSIGVVDDDVRTTITNNNPQPITLTNTNFYWSKNWLNMYVDYFRFNGNTFWGGDDYTPNTTGIGSSVALGSGSSALWEMDFDGQDGAIWGTFRTQLTFTGGGNSCTVDKTVVISAPPPTLPPQPTNTPVPTNTAVPATNTPVPSATPPICFDC